MWKRPDWKNPENYPNPDNAPLIQWAWEFLRRNPAYLSDYQRYLSDEAIANSNLIRCIEEKFDAVRVLFGKDSDEYKAIFKTYQKQLELSMNCLVIKPEAKEDETFYQWIERTGGHITRWESPNLSLSKKWLGLDRVSYLPCPSDDKAWDGEGHMALTFNTSTQMSGLNSRHETPKDDAELLHLYKQLSEDDDQSTKQDIWQKIHTIQFEFRYGLRGNVPMKEIRYKPSGINELLLKFDLSLPIKNQLKAAKYFFEKEQRRYKKLGREVINSRTSVKKYRDYLRVLDAFEEGTEKKEISKIIFPDKDNSYPDYLGDKNVDNYYKAALELQSQKYRHILLR